jgi:hypothetical protein
MKTINLLAGSFIALFVINTALFASEKLKTINDSPELTITAKYENSIYLYRNECNCECESCKDCTQRQVWGFYENGSRIMSDRDFRDFKKLITERTFESTKLSMAKNVIDINFFSTDQLREILGLFTFESGKLEIAKYTYSNTVDKNNYFRLFDLFTFESSVTELDEYIRNVK